MVQERLIILHPWILAQFSGQWKGYCAALKLALRLPFLGLGAGEKKLRHTDPTWVVGFRTVASRKCPQPGVSSTSASRSRREKYDRIKWYDRHKNQDKARQEIQLTATLSQCERWAWSSLWRQWHLKSVFLLSHLLSDSVWIGGAAENSDPQRWDFENGSGTLSAFVASQNQQGGSDVCLCHVTKTCRQWSSKTNGWKWERISSFNQLSINFKLFIVFVQPARKCTMDWSQ